MFPAAQGKRMNNLVGIVDDDASIRDSIRLLLGSVGIKTRCYPSALEYFADPEGSTCTCLIMDVRMPGLSGVEAQRQLNEMGSDAPIIFITGHGEIGMAVEVMKRGAVDFLQKPFKDQLLIDAVQTALARRIERRARNHRLVEVTRRLQALTPRERDVFEGVARGLRAKQIAAELGIAVKTVEEYRLRVFAKMHVKTAGELAGLAAELRVNGDTPL